MLIKFFCDNSMLWFSLAMLIVAILGVFLACYLSSDPKARYILKIILIVLAVIFFITLIVVGSEYYDYVTGTTTTTDTPAPTTTSKSTATPTATSTKSNATSEPTAAPEKVASAWLTDLTALTNDGVDIYSDSVTDNVGDEHAHRIFGVSGTEIKFYLRGNYETLSGVWYLCLRDHETTVSSSCKIYADDTLVYTCPSITGGDVPVEFSISLNGCEYLTIRFTSGNGEAELGDLKLQ